MLTEQQVRDTFARILPDCHERLLTSDPLHESCIWLFMTQEEIEAQLEVLKRPPSFENKELYGQGMQVAGARVDAAIASGSISRFVAPQLEEPLVFYTAEQLAEFGIVISSENPEGDPVL